MADEAPSGGYGSSSDPARDAVLKLVSKYGDVNKIPVQELLNIGRTREQAIATIQNYTQLKTQAAGKGKSFTVPQQWSSVADSMTKSRAPLLSGPTVKAGPGISQAMASAANAYTSPRAPLYPSSNNPAASYQDSDKANRTRAASGGFGGGGSFGAPSTPSTARGQDSWDRGNSLQVMPKATTPAATNASSASDSILSMLPQFLAAPPQPEPFKFTLNDFTDKANQMAAAAYSPQLAAVERAKQNVNTNYDLSSDIVQHLYSDLLDRIAQNTQQIQNNYANAQAANTKTGNELRSAIGDTYASSQDQLADLMTRIGAGGDAASAVLPQGAEQQAYQQSRALNNTQAQADALTSQGLAASDFQGAVSNAQAAQGAYQQQDLLRQKNNALQNWDWQGAQLAGQQGQQALSLAQQLTNQDLNLQQLNYGVGQDAYNNQLKGVNLSNDQVQQDYQNRLNAMNAAAQQIAAQNNNQLDWEKFDWQKQQDQISNELAAQNLLLNQQKANAPQSPTDVYGKINDQLTSIAGDRAAVLKSLAEEVFSAMDPAALATTNPAALALAFKQAAINLNRATGAGITPDEAERAAGVYAQSGIFGNVGR